MTRDTITLEGASHAQRALVLPVLACGLFASIIAFGDSERPVTGPSWWCIEGSECFATREACQAPPFGDVCVPRKQAWCSYECLTDRRPDTVCTTHCGTEREAVCTAETIDCVQASAPREPQLFPNYHQPGWWCGEWMDEGRQKARCTKDRRTCEWFVQVVSSRGDHCAQYRQLWPECKPHTGAVFCTSELSDKLEFVCAPTLPACQITFTNGKPLSSCEVWPYD